MGPRRRWWWGASVVAATFGGGGFGAGGFRGGALAAQRGGGVSFGGSPFWRQADFAQPRRGTGALILPLEASADQPVHSDTTTEAAARLLLGHTNSADGETNR